jgi:putative phage-type endonuclease
MNMIYHDFAQGSPEWLVHRAQHFNASDAPAMMGCSPYQTRTELLARMKTGITADVDAATQRRFDDGHRFEALARPLAEKIIGEDLYPVTGSQDELSASFDGLTLDGMTAFEHKTLNEALRYTPWDEGNGYHLPLHYQVQMEQQLMVSGADRVLFMATRWDGETLAEQRHCWYASDAALRAKIVAGWSQFAKDLIAYTPTEAAAPKPTGKAPEALPALHIVINGGVSASNLDEFKETALGAIRSVNRELTTDSHFADAEKAVKWCSDIEDRIKAAKDHALSQTASIDALFRTMDEISAEARRVRLDLDKLVKARKESMKAEIVASGVSALAKHIRELNAAMPADYMPTVPADFGGAIKGLRTIDSITNAVDTELARAKIHAGEVANRIHTNVGQINAANAPTLFPDMAPLVLKAPDDLAAIISQRLAAEQARREAETARIRAEEQARADAAAKAEADRLERERAHAAQVEAQRIARETAEAASAARIRDELIDKGADKPLTAAEVSEAESDRGIASAVDKVYAQGGGAFKIIGVDMASKSDIGTPTDDGARLTLGQINDILSPVSISVAGLSTLGFEPAAQVKASRLYRACDLPAICAAISAHVLAAHAEVA